MPLLDVAFGFFIWALHLLIVYISAAVSCVLGVAAAGSDARTTLLVVLALVTATAATLVLLHALRRYRQQRNVPDHRFRMTATVGCDLIATVAIVWQLFPVLLQPVCA
ncbi:MAG: hypothetical protein ACREKM_01930 [Longimicrobiales bacterium]